MHGKYYLFLYLSKFFLNFTFKHVKATGIYKNYGALPVLKGVDIEITKGKL